MRQFDINFLLKPIVDDIKKLEDGVNFNLNNRREVLFGTRTALVADNLASHMVGGFKMGFSKGFRKCRTCLALDSDIQSKFNHCDFLLRRKEDHDTQCAAMEVNALRKHFSWLYGINHNSILNSLKHFHVVGGLPPDIMHDLLEGVIPDVICAVLLHFLRETFFTLDEFNFIVQNFYYGHAHVRDKPSLITFEHLKKKITETISHSKMAFVCSSSSNNWF